jgi:hypothetical protein
MLSSDGSSRLRKNASNAGTPEIGKLGGDASTES